MVNLIITELINYTCIYTHVNTCVEYLVFFYFGGRGIYKKINQLSCLVKLLILYYYNYNFFV